MGEEVERPIREVELTAVISATFAVNLPANNKVVATIQLDPSIPAVSQLTVPVDETWVVEDLFVAAAQTPDSILEFLKNLTQSAYRSAPINGMVVTNVARPVPTPFMFEGASMITIVAQNLAAIGASALTITAYAKIRKFTPY